LEVSDSVVLEAAFCEWQRTCLENFADKNGYKIPYRKFETSAEECQRRVEEQFKQEKDKKKVKKYCEILGWFL
jgi:hypothetical protein